MKLYAQSVLTVMIICYKIYFVFFTFMVYANHKSIFYNENFQIYGINYLVNSTVEKAQQLRRYNYTQAGRALLH